MKPFENVKDPIVIEKIQSGENPLSYVLEKHPDRCRFLKGNPTLLNILE